MKTIRNNIAAATLALLSVPALACGFHFSDEETAYPGAMYVFWKNLTAQHTSVIQKIDPIEGESGFRRASWWLQLMSSQLEQLGVEKSYILLVDIPLWSHYDRSAFQKLTVDFDAAPKEDEDIVLMTTQAGLNALIMGDIDYSKALSEGILMVKNDPDDRVEALLTAEVQPGSFL